MPRATTPLKRDLLKAELAERLGLPLHEVFNRDEAARVLGLHPKTLSNNSATAPLFYKAPLGEKGFALYSLSDLRMWRDEKAKWAGLREVMKTSQRPWPPALNTPPTMPVKSDPEVLLENLKVDEDYKEKVLGRRPWA